MKKIILLVCILGMTVQISHAQGPVYIDPIGQLQNIIIPGYGIMIGKFNVIVIPEESFYLDSCWFVTQGVLPQVISNLRFNREDHPEYNPYTFWGSIQSNHLLTLGEIYNFPPISDDTTTIEFIADIGVNVLPPPGSTLFISLQCLGFSLAHEEIATNTAFGFPLILTLDPNMSIGDNVLGIIEQPSVLGKNGLIEIDSKGEIVYVYTLQNQLLWSGSGVVTLSLSCGVYIFQCDQFRKLIVVF